MPLTACPGCDEYIQVSPGVRMGELVTCPKCGADLEVVGLSPVELDWAEEGEEYEQDDEDDE